jgi:pyruvate,water dikinase
MAELIRWFKDLSLQDVALVGGKNSSLGEMFRELTPLGIKVPDGFATTAGAYYLLIEQAGIEAQLKQLLQQMEACDRHP